MAPLFKQEQLH